MYPHIMRPCPFCEGQFKVFTGPFTDIGVIPEHLIPISTRKNAVKHITCPGSRLMVML